MWLRPRLTSADDKVKLIEAIDLALGGWATYATNLGGFRRQIRRSRAVPTPDVPVDMVTMNSRVVLRNEHTGESIGYQLVYPEREAIHDGRISVLSPMGMALHGRRVGEQVTWISAAGPEVATIERLVYQPERRAREVRAKSATPPVIRQRHRELALSG